MINKLPFRGYRTPSGDAIHLNGNSNLIWPRVGRLFWPHPACVWRRLAASMSAARIGAGADNAVPLWGGG